MNARAPKARPLPAHPGLEILAEETVWDGRFPLQRVTFRMRRFDGGEGGVLRWELWRRGFAVAVLPYDPWADTVALIEQFRLPALAAGLHPVMTECPAGLLDDGEDAEDTARRELHEETCFCRHPFRHVSRQRKTVGMEVHRKRIRRHHDTLESRT